MGLLEGFWLEDATLLQALSFLCCVTAVVAAEILQYYPDLRKSEIDFKNWSPCNMSKKMI